MKFILLTFALVSFGFLLAKVEKTTLLSSNLLMRDSVDLTKTDTTTHKLKVKFFVDETGTIGSVKIISCDNCNKKDKKEFTKGIRETLKNQPKWGNSDKYPNGVWYILPINYKLTGDSISIQTTE